jgi:hypothetical protein
MLFLKKATLDQKIAAAVERVIADQSREFDKTRKFHWDMIQGFKDEIATLRADLAERETAVSRELALRIAEEREYQEAGVRGVLANVQAVQGDVNRILDQHDPEWDPRVNRLVTAYDNLAREVSHVDDTVSYLLASPATVIREVPSPDPATSTIAAFQGGWVKPLGSR